MEFGKYQVENLAFSEGQLTVYICTDLLDQQPVLVRALSGVDEITLDRWYDVYQQYQDSISNFRYLPRVRLIDSLRGQPFVSLDLESGNFMQHLDSKLSTNQLEELLDAVSHLHSKGIVHGGIDPTNVWISHTGNIKLYGTGEFQVFQQTTPKTIASDMDDLAQFLRRYGNLPSHKLEELAKGRFASLGDLLSLIRSDHVGLVEKSVITVPALAERQVASTAQREIRKPLRPTPKIRTNQEPVQMDRPQPVRFQLNEVQLKRIYVESSNVLAQISPVQRLKLMQHKVLRTFPVSVVIILHFFTFGLFTFFYFAAKFPKLPKITKKDFGAGKAIGLSLIPFFNLYWMFVFWLRLTDRINLQFRLRNQPSPIPKNFMITTLVLLFVPYAGFVAGLVLLPIAIGFIQLSCNKLARENGV